MATYILLRMRATLMGGLLWVSAPLVGTNRRTGTVMVACEFGLLPTVDQVQPTIAFRTRTGCSHVLTRVLYVAHAHTLVYYT